MPQAELLTMRDRCEFIAEWWEKKTGIRIEPKEFYEVHPQGELWPVFALYEQACAETGQRATHKHGTIVIFEDGQVGEIVSNGEPVVDIPFGEWENPNQVSSD